MQDNRKQGRSCYHRQTKREEGTLDEWEQWPRNEEMQEYSNNNGVELRIKKKVSYEGRNDGLFRAWVMDRKN